MYFLTITKDINKSFYFCVKLHRKGKKEVTACLSKSDNNRKYIKMQHSHLLCPTAHLGVELGTVEVISLGRVNDTLWQGKSSEEAGRGGAPDWSHCGGWVNARSEAGSRSP